LPSKIGEIREQPEVLLTIIYLVIVFSFLALMVGLAGENWQRTGKGEKEVDV
jgi:hypothetical protein